MTPVEVEKIREEWERGQAPQRSPWGSFSAYLGWREKNPAPPWAVRRLHPLEPKGWLA